MIDFVVGSLSGSL